MFADLDGDQVSEALLIVVESDYRETSTRLVCYRADGSILWNYRFGSEQWWDGEIIPSVYVGMFVQLFEGFDGRKYVLAVARNELRFPVQIVLLDPLSGALVQEWWHPGHVQDVVQFDLDGDGVKEILLGAENNPGEQPGHPALLVLQPTLTDEPAPRSAPVDEVPFWADQAGIFRYFLFALPDVFPARQNGAHVSRIDLIEGWLPRLRIGRGPNDWVYLDFNVEALTFEPHVGVWSAHVAPSARYRWDPGPFRRRCGTSFLGPLGGFRLHPECR